MASSSSAGMREDPISVTTYFDGEETNRRRELEFGVVREPPAPFYGHQTLVTGLAVLLDRHVRPRRLGQVCVSPVDVVLDRDRGLVVQPDLVYISQARRAIGADRIWGAPDLVVEVLSAGTALHDRTTKRDWYRHYDVAEYWLVDPAVREIEVVRLDHAGDTARLYGYADTVRSGVLPALRLAARRVFDR